MAGVRSCTSYQHTSIHVQTDLNLSVTCMITRTSSTLSVGTKKRVWEHKPWRQLEDLPNIMCVWGCGLQPSWRLCQHLPEYLKEGWQSRALGKDWVCQRVCRNEVLMSSDWGREDGVRRGGGGGGGWQSGSNGQIFLPESTTSSDKFHSASLTLHSSRNPRPAEPFSKFSLLCPLLWHKGKAVSRCTCL